MAVGADAASKRVERVANEKTRRLSGIKYRHVHVFVHTII